MNRFRDRRRSAGFTLVEVLVAFTILSFFMAAAFSGIAYVLHAQRKSSQVREAVRLAKTKMAELTSGSLTAPAPIYGRYDNGYTWTANMQPIVSVTDVPIEAYRIRVSVFGPFQSGKVELQTIVLASPVREGER